MPTPTSVLRGRSLVGELAGQTVTLSVILDAADVDRWVFVADRAYRVVAVEEVHSAVGGASAAVRPRKVLAAATSAPGAAADANVKELTAAAFDLTATINTTLVGTLVATAADLELADGDKIGLDLSGTLTGLKGAMTLVLRAL